MPCTRYSTSQFEWMYFVLDMKTAYSSERSMMNKKIEETNGHFNRVKTMNDEKVISNMNV